MTLSAKDYWKKTPLTAVEALADRLNDYLIENEDLSADLFDSYLEDLNDVETAIDLFRADDPDTLVDFIWDLDTAPREELIEAFIKDCGEIFGREWLGVELA